MIEVLIFYYKSAYNADGNVVRQTRIESIFVEDDGYALCKALDLATPMESETVLNTVYANPR
jgi:hypothetical protein